jgi:phage terminase large subunit-like protein
MTTWHNRQNLPKHYVEELERLDPNSRTYRQEVLAELLLDTPDALFNQESINEDRANPPEDPPPFKVLGYDPAASSGDGADEAGIIVVGYVPEVKSKARASKNGGGRPLIESPTQAYVLKDLSGHLAPSEQAELVIRTVLEEKIGDLIFEQNQGVDNIVTLLSHALKDQTADYTIRRHRKAKQTDFGPVKRFTVKAFLLDGTVHQFLISAIHAMKSKKVRAESVSYQYDTHRVHHPKDLPTCRLESCKQSLEIQMTTWSPNQTSGRAQSPDRMDALVYALFHVFGRHALHSNANSRLTAPTSTTTNEMTDQQKNPGKATRRHVSLYSVDMGERSTMGERILDLESQWGQSII